MNPWSTTLDEHANHYTTDEPMIYYTPDEHANHYTTDELMIYYTPDEHANHYTTDEPMIYYTQTSMLTIISLMNPWSTTL